MKYIAVNKREPRNAALFTSCNKAILCFRFCCLLGLELFDLLRCQLRSCSLCSGSLLSCCYLFSLFLVRKLFEAVDCSYRADSSAKSAGLALCRVDLSQVVFNMDGTVLPFESGACSAETIKALEACKEAGIITSPCSGRSIFMIPEEIKKAINTKYVIYCNGAYIADPVTEEIADSNPVDKNKIIELGD